MAKQVARVKKMTKAAIDETIAKIIALKAQKKQIEEELKENIALIEGMYREDANVAETISGRDFEAVKISKDNGKNKFNPTVVEAIIAALDPTVTKDIVTVEKVVDSKKFNKLFSDGYITENMLDSARLHKWTFQTAFSKKEKAAKAEAKEIAAVNRDAGRAITAIS